MLRRSISAFVAALLLAAAGAAPTKIIFDHDGGIDDFVTLLLLLSKPQDVELLAVTILDADCRVEVAANTTLKLLRTVGYGRIPVAVSTLPGVNPFPDVWRSSGISIDVLPLLNSATGAAAATAAGGAPAPPQLVQQPGQEFLAQLLLQQEEPVTVVATGPLSNLAYVLDKHGQAAASKIKAIVWMGGALKVHGNVREPGHDGSAEWNAYWDPAAVGAVWNHSSSVPLVVVPLDATNAVPVTPDLIYRFGPQANYLSSNLAGTIWARVISWVYERPDEPYFAWDTLTAACVMQPELCETERDVETYVVVEGASQGRTALADPGVSARTCSAALHSCTRNVSVVWHVDAEAFYTYVLDSLRL